MTQSDMTPPTIPLPDMSPPLAAGPVPQAKLYDAGSVGLATFLGSPLAGSVIMALTYRRLGQPSAAVKAVVIGVVATAALVGVGFLVPMGALQTGVGIGALIAMIQLAKRLQGPAVEAHTRAGGRLASRWAAAGIGLLALVAICGVLVGIVVAASGPKGTRLVIGTKDEIYYSGSATEADARTLGEALKKDDFFQDRGTSVFLSKAGGATILSFVVKDGIWDDAKSRAGFEAVAHDVAPSVGGLPVTLRLMNTSSEVQKEWVVR
jgi:hypothetical protein